MKGQVGYWAHNGGGVIVAFGEEMLRWLDRQGTERRVVVTIDRRRVLTVIADRSGPVVALAPASHRDYTHQYRSVKSPGCRTSDGMRGQSAILEVELLPFGLTEMHFEETDEGLVCEMPDECDLAWPRLDPDAHYGRDVAEVAEEVLQSRINAIIAAGQTSFDPRQRPHDAFRRLLHPGAWAKCVATAKALNSGGTL